MLHIPKTIFDEMLEHARATHPNECCGLLAGKNDRVDRHFRMTNTHASPVSYFMDPREQFAAFKTMRESGTDLVAIYHSHPHTQAYPSTTDVRLAYYPEVLYIIISLETPKPVAKGFRIVDGKITPEAFETA
jgi:[CysO sulfur-carrier protein]-S-L-cysteine hydrolase